jgi:hypothetical protein
VAQNGEARISDSEASSEATGIAVRDPWSGLKAAGLFVLAITGLIVPVLAVWTVTRMKLDVFRVAPLACYAIIGLAAASMYFAMFGGDAWTLPFVAALVVAAWSLGFHLTLEPRNSATRWMWSMLALAAAAVSHAALFRLSCGDMFTLSFAPPVFATTFALGVVAGAFGERHAWWAVTLSWVLSAAALFAYGSLLLGYAIACTAYGRA